MNDSEQLGLVLVSLAQDAGGRMNPQRILCRPPGSDSRAAFARAQALGWFDCDGYVTAIGREALETAPDPW